MARTSRKIPRSAWIAALALLAFAALLGTMRLLADDRPTKHTLNHVDGRRSLVVLVHGLTGREAFEPAVALAREELHDHDLLVFDYDARPLSNASPYAIANLIEKTIHEAHRAHDYQQIVLVGHSIGGMLLRKAIVWGSGLEEDRQDFGAHGERAWVRRVTRFVSLATINRGWSIEPPPAHMAYWKHLAVGIGERLGRLSHSGQLMLALQRGAPFVADTRVQWIELFRKHRAGREPPAFQTIHLLGDRDDIVSREDSMDLVAARGTLFVTLPDTGHAQIATALAGGAGMADENRREKIRIALGGDIADLDPARHDPPREDTSITRVVYLMHGIRDYGEWTDPLRREIERSGDGALKGLMVVNRKYGYFPMGPFLVYWNRQRNVRLFMDEYTENRARYPNAEKFDFVGHSNGTYILASALQHYRTLKVRRVYFAGSVVPVQYPWGRLADHPGGGRVEQVVNVHADSDWVVAIFPRFFEQIADWRGIQPVTGPLDLGAAGFRGFLDDHPAVSNVRLGAGSHGTGVEPDKLSAIADYIVDDAPQAIRAFGTTSPQGDAGGWVNWASKLPWVLWGLGAGILIYAGYRLFRLRRWAGGLYVLLLLLLLNSV